VTRDRIMVGLHEKYPEYDFLTHKGYITAGHSAALDEHGPCEIHRRRFVNVRRALGESVAEDLTGLGDNEIDELMDESMGIEPMEVGQ
jgi:ribonuclease HII